MVNATEFDLAAEWVERPENDIGFEHHKSGDCGPHKIFVDPSCERCAVTIALAAYAKYRMELKVKEYIPAMPGYQEAIAQKNGD